MSDDNSKSNRRSHWPAVVVGCLAAGGLTVWWMQPNSNRKVTANAAEQVEQSSEDKLPTDAELTKRLIGEWVTDRNGKRELQVREDGTATMTVTISTYHKIAFGDRMTFDISWKIEDRNLKFETTGGKPAWSIKAVTSVYGKSRANPILKLDADELILKDEEEGEPNHEWKRVK